MNILLQSKETKAQPTPKNIISLMKAEQESVLQTLKKTPDHNAVRFAQGENSVLDRYIELLAKVVS
jgi:hypothetical protein